MQQIKWFSRTFDFDTTQNTFPALIERMRSTPILLRYRLVDISTDQLKAQVDGRWSIQENVGHLLDLESLWHGRLMDLLVGRPRLRPADLENTQTFRAHYNERNISDLLDDFEHARKALVKQMEGLTEEDVFRSAHHPRLDKPMRTLDLFHFAAEHDMHHMARISWLIRTTARQARATAMV